MQRPDLATLERAVKDKPRDVQSRIALADVYISAGRATDAVTELRAATTLAPRNPAVWYGLGQAYNGVKQISLASFTNRSDGEVGCGNRSIRSPTIQIRRLDPISDGVPSF